MTKILTKYSGVFSNSWEAFAKGVNPLREIWKSIRKGASYDIGLSITHTGNSFERYGYNLQGNLNYQRQFSRHRTIIPLFERIPHRDKSSFIAPNATIVGNVILGPNSSIWYGCVLRGDRSAIRIGLSSNIQDRSVIFGCKDESVSFHNNLPPATIIGSECTIGHGSVLNSCILEDRVLIGPNSYISENCLIEAESVICPGSMLETGVRVPTGQMWAGNPAHFIRNLAYDELDWIEQVAFDYVWLKNDHAQTFDQYGTFYRDLDHSKVKRCTDPIPKDPHAYERRKHKRTVEAGNYQGINSADNQEAAMFDQSLQWPQDGLSKFDLPWERKQYGHVRPDSTYNTS